MQTLAHAVPTLEAGIDYLTCTAKRAHLAAALLSFGKDLVAQEEGSGGTRKGWNWQGFSGWSAGGARYGFNGNSTLLQCSGAAARESAAVAIGYSDNVSRLDVQVTVRTNKLSNSYAELLYNSLVGARRGRGRPIAHTLIKDTDGGSNCTFGKRISDQYGRVYNKSAEDKEHCVVPRWRYEIEYKRRFAKAGAEAYIKATDKEAWTVAQVYHWFAKRSCTPAFSAADSPNQWGAARGDSSQARRVQWLRVGVRPVVRKLAEEFGWPDVLALLGVPVSVSDTYVNETLCAEEVGA